MAAVFATSSLDRHQRMTHHRITSATHESGHIDRYQSSWTHNLPAVKLQISKLSAFKNLQILANINSKKTTRRRIDLAAKPGRMRTDSSLSSVFTIAEI